MDAADYRRSKEDEYFFQKEQELREKLRAEAERRAHKEKISSTLGIEDEELLHLLLELGFTSDTATLLHLVPLVQTAWADGEVTKAERHRIQRLAELRGTAPGSPAHAELDGWLTKRPPAEFFARSLTVIRALVGSLPEEQRSKAKSDLLSLCTEIATASGGILGFGKISAEEEQLLSQLASELEKAHTHASQKVLSQA